MSVDGCHAAVSLSRDNGVITDAGVAISCNVNSSEVGVALILNLSTGVVVGDEAGGGGAALPLNLVHSASLFDPLTGLVMGVGVAIRVLFVIGCAVIALVVNLSAGL